MHDLRPRSSAFHCEGHCKGTVELEVRPLDRNRVADRVLLERAQPLVLLLRCVLFLGVLFLGVLFLGTGGALFAQDALAPWNVADIRAASAVAVAPDGQHIAYVLGVPRRPLEEDSGPAWTELWILDRQGEARPFVTGKVNVRGVAWTPDGTRISFLAKRGDDEHRSLYTIPLTGGESRKILDHSTEILSYSWSPDGQRVAFLATPPKSEEEEKLEEKGFSQVIYEEDRPFAKLWVVRPDAEHREDSEVSADSADSADSEDSEDSEEAGATPFELEGSARTVKWSPVDDRILVVLTPTPLVDDTYTSKRIDIVDPDTGKVVAKVSNSGKLGAIQWSPDGSRVAMISAADINDPKEGRLMVASSAGGRTRDVVPNFEGHLSSFAWRDDTTLMFVADRGVYTSVGLVRADGKGLKSVVPPGGPVLTSLSLSEDGETAAFTGQSPTHPSEVFTLTEGNDQPRRRTQSNPWLDDINLAPQEPLRFTASDGLELEGVLIRPLNEQAGTRAPLILVVHGGPESHYRNGWLTSYSLPGQVAAARGFAVFYPNYRGSTGRGVEFSKISQADAAGKEFEDLVDAVDHLVKIGLVDRDKVGITGGSYGGYASAWGATYYSDRFAASVMFVGISDNVSKVGTTDIPREMYDVHHRKWLWDDWDYFRERSPIYHVKRARTPILILAGEDDTRVHPSQSLELYRHLKVLDQAPVRLVFYPGEGHGNRKSAARFDYNLRMLRWMEYYLKGPGGPPPPYEIDYAKALPYAEAETE